IYKGLPRVIRNRSPLAPRRPLANQIGGAAAVSKRAGRRGAGFHIYAGPRPLPFPAAAGVRAGLTHGAANARRAGPVARPLVATAGTAEKGETHGSLGHHQHPAAPGARRDHVRAWLEPDARRFPARRGLSARHLGGTVAADVRPYGGRVWGRQTLRSR